MATVYLDLNASTNGSGNNSSDPFNSGSSAEAGAGAGGTIVLVANTIQNGNDWQNTYFDFDADVFIKAETRRTVTLQDGSVSSYVVRYSDPVSTRVSLQGVIVDPVIVSKASAIRYDDVPATGAFPKYLLQDCQIKTGISYGVDYRTRSGSLQIINLDVVGDPTGPALAATSNISAKGNTIIDVQALNFNYSSEVGSTNLVSIQQVSSPANDLDVSCKALNGVLNFANNASSIVFRVDANGTVNIANSNVTLNGDEATSVTGFFIQGKGANTASDNFETTSANITNNKIKFNIPAGYGISFGQSGADSHITSGSVSGNTITGKYYASATPHNILMGRGTAGKCKGNLSQDGYVGILASICDTGTEIIGNTILDCYGPNIYCKGTVEVSVKDNVCIQTGKYTQRDRGILAVARQDLPGNVIVNTAAATIQENLIIVKDLSKIHSLAYIEANQTASFVRNTYIVDESQYNETAKYFTYKNGQGGAPNNTITEWNAQSEVTNEVLLPLPASEIDSLIENLKTTTGSTFKIIDSLSDDTAFAAIFD